MVEDLVNKPVGCEETEEWPVKKKERALRILMRQRGLILSLTVRDIRSRYKQSVLGIAWALITPIVMTAVFTIVFSVILKMKTPIPYPIFFYTAILPWTFLTLGLTTGTECLVGNFNLITKIYFPREVFPIAAILGKTVDLALGVLVLVPLFIYYHIHLTPFVFLVIPILLIQTFVIQGVVFMLSSANLFYRDIRHVVPLFLEVWKYLCPIVYGLDKIFPKLLPFYMLNPMSPIIDAYRRVALEGKAPQWGYLGIAAITSIILLTLGYRMFKKLEPAFAEAI
jgi:lipopolysaccharide transport system permease protein